METTKLDAAMYKAGQVAPFLRIALASCHVVISESAMSNGEPTTMCDEYWRVYVHPGVLTKTVPEISHYLLHEVSHLVRRHHKRLRGRPQEKANVAGDCEIESHNWRGLQRPSGGVTPQKFDLRNGLTAEAYFELLPDFNENEGGISDCGSGASGGTRPWDLPAKAAPTVGDTKAESIAQQTAEAIQKNGRGAGHAWLKWAAEQLNPSVDWKRKVRAWLNSSRVKHGSSKLSSMNPRIKNGIMRKGWVGRKVRINGVTDTSGSMGGKPIAIALAEVIGIARACELDIFWQDDGQEPTIQRHVRRWEDLEPTGGGGTDLRPAIALAAAEEPDGLIIITDCDTPWEPMPPGIPTLVVRVPASPYSVSAPPPSWESITIN